MISSTSFNTEMLPFLTLWPQSSRAPKMDPVKSELKSSLGSFMIHQESGVAASAQLVNCPL